MILILVESISIIKNLQECDSNGNKMIDLNAIWHFSDIKCVFSDIVQSDTFHRTFFDQTTVSREGWIIEQSGL